MFSRLGPTTADPLASDRTTLRWPTSVRNGPLSSVRGSSLTLCPPVYNQLEALGCEQLKKVPLGEQVLDGVKLELPPAVLAQYGALLESISLR